MLSKIAGVEFRDCYRRRVTMLIDDLSVPVIALEDLKKSKLATGRPQDASDVQKLEAGSRRNCL